MRICDDKCTLIDRDGHFLQFLDDKDYVELHVLAFETLDSIVGILIVILILLATLGIAI